MTALCDEAKDRLHDAVEGTNSLGSLAQALVGLIPKEADTSCGAITDCLNQLFGPGWPRELLETMQMVASLNKTQSKD